MDEKHLSLQAGLDQWLSTMGDITSGVATLVSRYRRELIECGTNTDDAQALVQSFHHALMRRILYPESTE